MFAVGPTSTTTTRSARARRAGRDAARLGDGLRGPDDARPGVAYTTLELKVNYVRPMTRETGRVVCEATVVHRGGTIATAEGRLVAEETGKLLAHGTTTCLVLAAERATRTEATCDADRRTKKFRSALDFRLSEGT